MGVWEKETLVAYLIIIWQPSHFLCSFTLILCHFYLGFPYQLTSATPFVWWHIIEKMQGLEWMSLPLSLAITLPSEAVSMFSVCSQMSLTLYLTAILGALKVIPMKDDEESRVAQHVVFCCLWTRWLDQLGSPKFQDTHTDSLLKHPHATAVSLVPSCRLDINYDFQTVSQMPCRIPGADVFHILKWSSPNIGSQPSVPSNHKWVAGWHGKSTAFSLEWVALCTG